MKPHKVKKFKRQNIRKLALKDLLTFNICGVKINKHNVEYTPIQELFNKNITWKQTKDESAYDGFKGNWYMEDEIGHFYKNTVK